MPLDSSPHLLGTVVNDSENSSRNPKAGLTATLRQRRHSTVFWNEIRISFLQRSTYNIKAPRDTVPTTCSSSQQRNVLAPQAVFDGCQQLIRVFTAARSHAHLDAFTSRLLAMDKKVWRAVPGKGDLTSACLHYPLIPGTSQPLATFTKVLETPGHNILPGISLAVRSTTVGN